MITASNRIANTFANKKVVMQVSVGPNLMSKVLVCIPLLVILCSAYNSSNNIVFTCVSYVII